MFEYMKKGINEILEAMAELEINENMLSSSEIKKAYHRLCKKYHPDQMPLCDERKAKLVNKYLKVQQAYELLDSVSIFEMKQALQTNKRTIENSMKDSNESIIKPCMYYQNGTVKREAKIFSTNKEAARQQARQQLYQVDKNRMKKEQQQNKQHQEKNVNKRDTTSEQEDILRKIETIWLAEIIHRQIEEDKKQIEKENIRKLKRAFLQRDDFKPM